MKVVILAGGYGSRLSEYTENIPIKTIDQEIKNARARYL